MSFMFIPNARHKRYAMQPKCGFGWYGRRDGEHLHICKVIQDHAGEYHRCSCGSTRAKPKFKGPMVGRGGA